MIQPEGYLGRLLGPLLKTGLPLIKNVIEPLAESVLIPLGLTAHHQEQMQEYIKKISGPGHNNTTLIISNNEMEDIIKIVKSLEDSGLLLKGVNETVQNEAREQKGAFLSMLLVTLGATLLGNILANNGVIAKSVSEETKSKREGRGINRPGEGIATAGYGNKKTQQNEFLMPPHPLTNFEIHKYDQNEPWFNGVYSRDNLPKRSFTEIKDGAYVINLDEYSDIGANWIALYVDGASSKDVSGASPEDVQNNDVTYFDSFGVFDSFIDHPLPIKTKKDMIQ